MDARCALITGFAGFTSSHLLHHLQQIDPALIVVGTDVRTPSSSSDCEFIEADLLDGAAVRELIRRVKPSQIYHLAGLNSSDDPRLLYDVNVIGTMNLLEAVKENRDQIDARVLIVGSAAEYGIVSDDELPISEDNPLRPISHYGVSKAAQTLLGFQYARACDLNVVCVRPFNLIGPGQSADFVCGAFARQITDIEKGTREPEMLVGNLAPERDFVDVRDVVQAYAQLMSAGKHGEVYNIGSGECSSIKGVLKILLSGAGTEIAIRQDVTRMRQSDIPRQVSDIDKILRETNWVPAIPLEESLWDMLDYFRTIRHS